VIIPGSKKKPTREKKTQARVIAVDFDGTIHDVKNPIKSRRMGGPIEGAKEALRMLLSKGYEVVIFCYWAKDPQSIKTISDWMTYYRCPYSEITNIKPYAEAYIDDKGIRFTDWEDVLAELHISTTEDEKTIADL